MSIQFGFGGPQGNYQPQRIFSPSLGFFGGQPPQAQPFLGFPQALPTFGPPQQPLFLGVPQTSPFGQPSGDLQAWLALKSLIGPSQADLNSLQASVQGLSQGLPNNNAFKSNFEIAFQYMPLMAATYSTPTLLKENFSKNNIGDVMVGSLLQGLFASPQYAETSNDLIQQYLQDKDADLNDDNQLNGSSMARRVGTVNAVKLQKSFYKLDRADDGELNGSFVKTIQAELLTRQMHVENEIVAKVGLENSPFDIGHYGLDGSKIHARELRSLIEGLGINVGTPLTKGILVDELEHRKTIKEFEDTLNDKLSSADYQQNQNVNTRTIQVIEFVLENFDKLAKVDGQRGLTLNDLIQFGDKAIDHNTQLKDSGNPNAFVTSDIINTVLKD